MAGHPLRSTIILLLLVVYGSLQSFAQAPPGLLDIHWVLRSFDNPDGSRDTITRLNPTLWLDSRPWPNNPNSPSRMAHGSTPCNSWSGSYRIFSADSIGIGVGSQSILFCLNGGDYLERRYLYSLSCAQHYDLKGNYLSIHFVRPDSGSGTMNFTREYPLTRFVNLIEDTPLDLQTDWDTIPRFSGLAYGSASPLLPLTFGPHALRTMFGTTPNRITLTESTVPGYPESTITLFAMGRSLLSAEPLTVVQPSYQESHVGDSVLIALLVASRDLAIERIWIEEIDGRSVLDYGSLQYGQTPDFHLIPVRSVRLRLTLQGDTTKYSFAVMPGYDDLRYDRTTTFIIQRNAQSGLRIYALYHRSNEIQTPMDTLQRMINASTVVRLVNLRRFDGEWQVSSTLQDTLRFRDAGRFHHVSPGPLAIREWLDYDNRYEHSEPIEVVPDSINTVYILDSRSLYSTRAPLETTMPQEESRLRFLKQIQWGNVQFDVQVRHISGGTAQFTVPVYNTVTTWNNTPSGQVEMTLFRQGETVPILRVRGELPSSYVTAIISGYIQDSTAINLLNESDSSAQAPMLKLQRLPLDTARGRFRTVNVMQGGADLCAHFSGNDSLCLPYRTASHHYVDYAGLMAEKIEVEWEGGGRGNIQPTALRPDTLTTLFALGRAGTHITIAQFLETPLNQPVSSGRAMLRVLNAAYGSDVDSIRLYNGIELLFSAHPLFSEVTSYRSVPSGMINVPIYRGTGVREVQGLVPEGHYATLIIRGSDDSIGIDLLIDSDSADQIPLIHFNQIASVASTGTITSELTLTPNPANELVTVILPLQREESVEIEIHDSRGTMVRRQEALGVPGTQGITISTSQLPAGMYEVVVRNGKGEMYGRGRVVVVR
jgi:hypothetical protein